MRSKFALHDLIVVIEPITIEPCNTIVKKGERGKVIDIDPDTNDLTVRLSAQFPDLHCQRNCILVRADEARQHIKHSRNRSRSRIFGVKLCAIIVGGIMANTATVVGVMTKMHAETTETIKHRVAGAGIWPGILNSHPTGSPWWDGSGVGDFQKKKAEPFHI